MHPKFSEKMKKFGTVVPLGAERVKGFFYTQNGRYTFLIFTFRLVDLYPESAVSWFAVGCYYYMAGKQDPARR